MRYIETDVLVIGAGGAGLTAASVAMDEGVDVWLVSKDPIACSDTKISEGIMTVLGSGTPTDTPDVLFTNMRLQGDDLSDPNIVRAFAEDSQLAYNWLRESGMRPRIDGQGKPEIIPKPLGGHNRARTVDHSNKGLDFGVVLRNRFLSGGNRNYIEDAWALDLIMNGNQTAGALVYHASEGEFITFFAKAVILACGGAGTLYFPNTDTMRGNTGDAYAMALRAGAALIDMEQIQFLPFGLTSPPAFQGILAGEPVIAGMLGVIRDRDGKKILGEVMVRTRAEAAAAITNAVTAGKGTRNNGCYLDLTGNAKGTAGKHYVSLMESKIPGILSNIRRAIGKEAARFQKTWEVRPTAHYCMGGIEVDDQGKVAGLEGVFAAGQAMGGLHGSNRLGSTSLSEIIVFGRRAGIAAAALSKTGKDSSGAGTDKKHLAEALLSKYQSYFGREGKESPHHLILSLQQACWESIGPSRSESGVRSLLKETSAIEKAMDNLEITSGQVWNQGFIDSVELQNMLIVANAIASSAAIRTGSIGAHIRSDARKVSLAAKKPYSVRVSGKAPGDLRTEIINRQKTGIFKRLHFRFSQGLKILGLRFFSLLPDSVQDRLLLNIYKKITAAQEA